MADFRPDPEALAIWKDVLEINPEFGLELTTDQADTVGAELYRVRKWLADPRLEDFRIVKLRGGRMFIVRKEVSLEDGPNVALD